MDKYTLKGTLELIRKKAIKAETFIDLWITEPVIEGLCNLGFELEDLDFEKYEDRRYFRILWGPGPLGTQTDKYIFAGLTPSRSY